MDLSAGDGYSMPDFTFDDDDACETAPSETTHAPVAYEYEGLEVGGASARLAASYPMYSYEMCDPVVKASSAAQTEEGKAAESAASLLAEQLAGADKAQWQEIIAAALELKQNSGGGGVGGSGVGGKARNPSLAKAKEAAVSLAGSSSGQESVVAYEDQEWSGDRFEEQPLEEMDDPTTVGSGWEEENSDSQAEEKAGASLDWNESFQRGMAEIHGIGLGENDKTRLAAYARVASLANDFVATATMYGKIIIAEVNAPLHLKTIPPASLGGIVGGDKYVVNGILFKFPTAAGPEAGATSTQTSSAATPKTNRYTPGRGSSRNEGGMYSRRPSVDFFAKDASCDSMASVGSCDSSCSVLYDEDAAAKIAKHELRGLTSVFRCNIKGLHCPMIALIDYLGFRLIAMSLLPLGSARPSLVYGSNDAGLTVHMEVSDKEKELFEDLAGQLNLKAHMAGVGQKRQVVHGPADLEGHHGTDGRLYLLDFSRMMPPETPQKGIKGAHLFRLLRPELVQTNPTPLCSDAFSGFVMVREEAAEHNSEVRDATQRALEEVIPRVANNLNKLSEHGLKQFFRDSRILVEVLHSNGINLRHVGLLRHRLRSEYLRVTVLVEMAARALKQIIRRDLRSEVRTSVYPSANGTKGRVVTCLNGVFGVGGDYWQAVLVPEMKRKYQKCLSEEEDQPYADLRRYIHEKVGLSRLLCRFLDVSGIRCVATSLSQACGPKSAVFDCPSPFDVTDIETLDATAHHMPSIDNYTGYVLLQKARQRLYESGRKDGSFLHLCKSAIRRFELSLYAVPHCTFTLRNYAHTLFLLNKPRQAMKYYQLAVQSANGDLETLVEFTIFLLNIGRYKEGVAAMRDLLASGGDPSVCLPEILRKSRTTANATQVLTAVRSACKMFGGEAYLKRVLRDAEQQEEKSGRALRGRSLVTSFSANS